MPEKLLPISKSLRRIHSGDLLRFRPSTRVGWWIWALGRSEGSHWAIAYWSTTDFGRRRLKVLEQIKPEGREVSFKNYLIGLPSGCVDVYRLAPGIKCDLKQVVEWALDHGPGIPYDSRGMLRSLLTHLPFLRWFFRPNTDDAANGREQFFCTAYVAAAFHLGGGLDLVHGRADRDTEPAELETSGLLKKKFTMVTEERGKL
ncbi:MAG: hypothetical protein V1755_06595 [Chloroflexota bacterium]